MSTTGAGASGNLATEYVVNSAPDGYTLLVAISSNAINPSLFSHLNFNFMRDMQPVGRLGSIPLVVAVTPSFPAQTLPEFIAYLKANPGKVTMASGGTGSPAHVAEELFCMTADVNMMHVPYRGEGPALPDVMSGQINVIFAAMPASLGYLKAGKLRPLAVTSATRQPALPDVPAVSEFLPGYEASGWYGIVAPEGRAASDRRQAQCRDQCGAGRSHGQRPLRGSGADPVAGFARGFHQIHCRRDGKMGQGRQVRGHCAAINERATPFGAAHPLT